MKIMATILLALGGLLGLERLYDQLRLTPTKLLKPSDKWFGVLAFAMLLGVATPALVLSRLGTIPTRTIWEKLPGWAPHALAGVFLLYVVWAAARRLKRIVASRRRLKESPYFWLAVVGMTFACGLCGLMALRNPTLFVEWITFGILAVVGVLTIAYGPLGLRAALGVVFRGRTVSATLAVLLVTAASLIQVWAS